MASTLNNLPSGANWCPGVVHGNVRSYQLRFCFPTPIRAPSRRSPLLIARARSRSAGDDKQLKNSKDSVQSTTEEVEEVEEDLPWIQEKALDLVEFTGTVTHAIPGPRVGQSPLPWILAIPLAYVGITFVFAVFKTVKKFTSPRTQRKRLVNKNAVLLRSIDELFQNGRDEVNHSALEGLMHKTGFNMDDILRKYIRYALNERPFSPDTVADLIHLRKASMLEDHQVAEVLNELSKRIVKEKGPVVMDISGFTEKGFKRKLAVQALFGKVFYLSEFGDRVPRFGGSTNPQIPEFCSRDSSLVVKEIFGVTDDDADSLRLNTHSESGDVESLENLVVGAEYDEPRDESSTML